MVGDLLKRNEALRLEAEIDHQMLLCLLFNLGRRQLVSIGLDKAAQLRRPARAQRRRSATEQSSAAAARVAAARVAALPELRWRGGHAAAVSATTAGADSTAASTSRLFVSAAGTVGASASREGASTATVSRYSRWKGWTWIRATTGRYCWSFKLRSQGSSVGVSNSVFSGYTLGFRD